MSSFDTAREKWELYHMEERDKVKEAAAKGDPEAMEILAYHISKIEYNCRDKVIELLTAASDAGRETASWKLADLYANWDKKEYHDKIEHYCRLAFASGRTYSHKQPECIYGSIQYWIEKHHPEWREMKEGFYSSGRYYLIPTYRYGMNVFRGIGEEAARQKLRDEWEPLRLQNIEKAEAGDPEAMENMALYEHRIGSPKEAVLKWLLPAAESGRPTACFRLADLYAYSKYLGDDTMIPKIEQYCMRAFEADVPLDTEDLLYQDLESFIKHNHPEWFEQYKIIRKK